MPKTRNARVLRYLDNSTLESDARRQKNQALAKIICRDIANKTTTEIDLILNEIPQGSVENLLQEIRCQIARQSTSA